MNTFLDEVLGVSTRPKPSHSFAPKHIKFSDNIEPRHSNRCNCTKCEQRFNKSRFGIETEFGSFENDEFSPLNSFGEQGGGTIDVKNRKELSKADQVGIEALNKAIILHNATKAAWEIMVKAARDEGIQDPLLLPTSGYRSVAHQKQLWDKALEKYGSEKAARKWVAKPGNSSHQTGRAMDLYLGLSNDSRNVEKLKRTNAFKWLEKNGNRFGFYNYLPEPWHWEYNPTAVQENFILSLIASIRSYIDDLFS